MASSTGSTGRAGGSTPPRSRSSSPKTAGVDRPPRCSAITQCRVWRDSTGTICSPRPVPSAVPPCSANVTSLPSSAARAASSSRDRSSFHSADRPTSAAAASALPPAMPPATGMPLRKTRAMSGSRSAPSASSSTARQARLVSSAGTSVTPSPCTAIAGSGLTATETSSNRLTAWNTVTRSWKPSSRSPPTSRWRLILAGTRTVTGGGTADSTAQPYGVISYGRPRRRACAPSDAGGWRSTMPRRGPPPAPQRAAATPGPWPR